MEEKIYVVTLGKRSDLNDFYLDMMAKGFRLSAKRPISRNTHYWMTEEQAIELRKDSRVRAVELTPEELGLKPMPSGQYVNNNSYEISGNFWKNDTISPITISPNDFQWGHIHCAGDASQRGKGEFGSISQGGTYEQVNDTVSVFNDGKHVDVVICDDPTSYDCDEWKSPSTGQTRFVQYDWYSELNQYILTIDDDYGSLNSIPSPPYSNYFDNASNPTSHGTHVTGTVAGQHYGWAREANIYSMQVLGNDYGFGTSVPSLLMFDYLRAFHRYKPINSETGFRNPTITNHSWGYRRHPASIIGLYERNESNLVVPSRSISIDDVYQVYYNGVTYNSSNPGPSGWTLDGIEEDFGIPNTNFSLTIPSDYEALRADIEDAIEDGVIVIGAAGNQNFRMVPETDPNWNNYITYIKTDGLTSDGEPTLVGPEVVGQLAGAKTNRGSSPSNAKGAIAVGALSNYSDFRRASFSNYGPAVDIFAPGMRILSAYNDNGLEDNKYGGAPNYFYPIQGTSMASPQVAGVAACLATGKARFTNADVIGYIRDYCTYDDMSWDLNGGGGSDNTCRQGSPDITLKITNPRQQSGYLVEQKSERTSGLVFPRTNNFIMGITDTGDYVNTPSPDPSETFTFDISTYSSLHYVVTGQDRSNNHSSSLDPTINVNIGDILIFNVDSSGHPFQLKYSSATGPDYLLPEYDSNSSGPGVINNGTESGTVTLYTSGFSSGSTIFYRCQYHYSMLGEIVIS